MANPITSMYSRIGPAGLFGILVMIAGIGLVALESLIVAAGLALILAGIGLVVRSMIQSVLQSFGMMPA